MGAAVVVRPGHWLIAVAVAGSIIPSMARANGRFPRAERLIEDPADPSRLLLAATYGLLTTHDGGKTWFHTCEAAFAGLSDYTRDPILDLVAGGAALVDVQASIKLSLDDCVWTQTLGTSATGEETIDDFAVDRVQGRIVIAAITNRAGGSTSIELRESTDAGMHWAPIGSALPLSTLSTVDLDPSDPAHLYASGLSTDGAAVLLSSVDHATSWTTRPILGASAGDVPYIAAIDPKNPNGIFVRTDSVVTNAQGGYMANDALLHSEDGGSTWTVLLRKNAKLLGFALSPDGANVVAGYGIDDASTEIAAAIDASQTGLFLASASDWRFQAVFAGQPVTCLTWTSLGTYACTQLPASGSLEELVRFPNGALAPDAGISQSTPLMRLSEIAGPRPCCGAVDSVCDWSTECAVFNACSRVAAVAASCDGGPTDASTDTVTDAIASPGRARVSSGCACGSLGWTIGGARGRLLLLAWSAVVVARRSSRRHVRGSTTAIFRRRWTQAFRIAIRPRR